MKYVLMLMFLIISFSVFADEDNNDTKTSTGEQAAECKDTILGKRQLDLPPSTKVPEKKQPQSSDTSVE